MNNRRSFLSSLVGLFVGSASVAVGAKESEAQQQRLHITVRVDSNRVAEIIRRDYMNNGRIRQTIESSV